MGTNFSTQKAITIANIIDEINNNITSNIKSYASQDCINNQNINVELGSDSQYCLGTIKGDLIVQQRARVSCKLQESFDGEAILDVSNDISDKIAQSIDQATKQKNEALSFGINQANTYSLSEVAISSAITNNMSSNFESICKQNASSFQNQTIKICGVVGKNAFLTQSADVLAIQECVNEFNNTLSTNNTLIRDIDQKTKQITQQINEGLASILKWIAIIVAAVMVISIIGSTVYLITSSKKGKPSLDISKNASAITAATALLKK